MRISLITIRSLFDFPAPRERIHFAASETPGTQHGEFTLGSSTCTGSISAGGTSAVEVGFTPAYAGATVRSDSGRVGTADGVRTQCQDDRHEHHSEFGLVVDGSKDVFVIGAAAQGDKVAAGSGGAWTDFAGGFCLPAPWL